MTDVVDDTEVADELDETTDEPGSFSDFVRMLWDGDLFTTADKLEVELDLNEAQKALLRDVLVNAIRLVMRRGVRDHEDQIDNAPQPVKGEKLDVSGDKRFAFLKDSFALPDGTFVMWGEASAADHEARIGMLHKLRDGIDKTINRHQSVMAQIVKNKVRCLNDLYASGGTK